MSNKNENEKVRCPKASSGECLGKNCPHYEEHLPAKFCSTATPQCSACRPVKPKNVVALLKSIAHWDLIAQGLETTRGIANCECCKQFRELSCTDCLIAKNGYYKCQGTPYEKVTNKFPTKYQTPEALDAIEAEVELLISCLPEAEQKAFSLENVQPFLRFGDKVWREEREFLFIGPCPDGKKWVVYDEDGKYLYYSLWSKLSLFPPKPKPQLWESFWIGQPIVVWDDEGDERKADVAFFSCYEEDSSYPIVTTGKLNFDEKTNCWKNFRLLTRAEARKFGFDLNRWQWADDETKKGETK